MATHDDYRGYYKMKKFAVPGTFVPNAVFETVDLKGRAIWNMPEPIGYHKTQQVVSKYVTIEGKPKRITVKEKVAFPIYRGFPASYVRYARSQFRRIKRKLAQKEALAQSNTGAVDTLRQFILNPGEQNV